jgi:hypothetical protein
VRYEAASKARPKATGCQTGTRALALAVHDVYPEFLVFEGGYGCYSQRKIAGTMNWSLHAEGRAMDVGVPAPLKPIGWQLACELVAGRQFYGVQYVAWDNHSWSITYPDQWKSLTTSNKHTDHIHFEQYWTDALRPPSMRSLYAQHLRAARRDEVT